MGSGDAEVACIARLTDWMILCRLSMSSVYLFQETCSVVTVNSPPAALVRSPISTMSHLSFLDPIISL